MISHNDPAQIETIPGTYDCVVIGAGVAGGLAAFQLATAGQKILLVDAKSFPREKVCGCCLNLRGQQILKSVGLEQRLHQQPHRSIENMNLRLAGRSYRWQVPHMLSIRRSALDALLVEAAVEQGATFCDHTRATVLPATEPEPQAIQSRRPSEWVPAQFKTHSLARRACICVSPASTPIATSFRRVELNQGDQQRIVTTKLVLVADGLNQSSLARLPEFQSRVTPSSRIGVQTFLPTSRVPEHLQSSLTMIVGRQGYVGIAPVDAGYSDFAAAIDPELLDSKTRPWKIVQQILEENGVMVETNELASARWRATPPLTRRSSRSGSHRVLVIGDSLGYVEPFTGEGMSWAMTSAMLVQPIAMKAIEDWSDEYSRQWSEQLQTKIVKQQWLCSQLSKTLRSPFRARLAAGLCQHLPPLRKWALQKVSLG